MKNLDLILSRSTLPTVNSFDDLRRTARRRLPRMIFDFVDGGADRETTLRDNVAAFERARLVPRFLRDVSQRDTSTTVLGHRIDLPFVLAPAGLATVVHPDGELAAARAAGAAGTIFTASIASGYTIEEIADVATGPLWFQLYLWKDDRVVREVVRRAAAAGCSALVVTVDVPMVGKRERDLRNGMSLPPSIRPRGALDAAWRLGWLRGLATGPAINFANLVGIAEGDSTASIGAYVDRELVDQTATWDRLDWLRTLWDGPLVVKGVLSVDDAREAVTRGADAVYVSNHGGRQLDGSPATLDVLPRVVEAVGDRVEVFVDGGVRRGADLVVARAMGARVALGGRPWYFGLAADGERGVSRSLELLRTDLDRALALIGVPRFDDVDGDVLRTPGR
jgi:L-lactate dehydrogenase (cytochrome)